MHPATTRGRAVPSSHRRLRAAAPWSSWPPCREPCWRCRSPPRPARSRARSRIAGRSRSARRRSRSSRSSTRQRHPTPAWSSDSSGSMRRRPCPSISRSLVDAEHHRPDPRLRPVRDHRRRDEHLAEPDRRAGHHRRPDQRDRADPGVRPGDPGRRRSRHHRAPGGDGALAGGGLDRGAHQGRDRDARRRQVRPIRIPTNARLLDRVRPEPARSRLRRTSSRAGSSTGRRSWQNREGVSAITGGKAVAGVTLPGDTRFRHRLPVALGRALRPRRRRRRPCRPSHRPSRRRRTRERRADGEPPARPRRPLPTPTPDTVPTPTPTPSPRRPDADPDAGPDANADRRRHPDRRHRPPCPSPSIGPSRARPLRRRSPARSPAP